VQVLINEFCQAEKIKIISEGTQRALKLCWWLSCFFFAIKEEKCQNL